MEKRQEKSERLERARIARELKSEQFEATKNFGIEYKDDYPVCVKLVYRFSQPGEPEYGALIVLHDDLWFEYTEGVVSYDDVGLYIGSGKVLISGSFCVSKIKNLKQYNEFNNRFKELPILLI